MVREPPRFGGLVWVLPEAARHPRMIRLIFPGKSLSELGASMRGSRLESFVLALARPVRTGRSDWRLLVESIHIPDADCYEVRSETASGATVRFRLPIEKRARLEGLSLVYGHSHPLEPGRPAFSAIDDQTEPPLARYAADRVPKVPH